MKALATAVITVLVICVLAWWFAPANMVAVKIYKHDKSGNMIYCRTGELTDEFHTYMGEGKIDEDKAVEC